MVSETKNPVFVESGRKGAQRRWGGRVVRLDELEAPYRRAVLALVAAAKAAPATGQE